MILICWINSEICVFQWLHGTSLNVVCGGCRQSTIIWILNRSIWFTLGPHINHTIKTQGNTLWGLTNNPQYVVIYINHKTIQVIGNGLRRSSDIPLGIKSAKLCNLNVLSLLNMCDRQSKSLILPTAATSINYSYWAWDKFNRRVQLQVSESITLLGHHFAHMWPQVMKTKTILYRGNMNLYKGYMAISICHTALITPSRNNKIIKPN